MHMSGAYCQSCGMPLSQDPMCGGTEAGGDRSKDYCSYCYQNGQFTKPDMTASQMVDFCKGKLREMKLSENMVDEYTRNIPNLKRWRK